MTRPKLKIPPGVTCVSPSQMSVAKACWRKWGFTYILGQREPGGRGAALGGVVHLRHEDYLNGIAVPDPHETWTFRAHLTAELHSGDVKRVAEAEDMLRTTSANSLDKTFYPGKVTLNMMPQGVYPAPGEGLVEHHFVYKRTPSIWYQGLIDWHAYDPKTKRLKVMDHKTSSDPKRYGQTDETLGDDHQALIYARAMVEEYAFEPDVVELLWNYGKSDGVAKHSYVARVEFDNIGNIYAKFENEVHPWAEEMHRLKQMGADPLSLDPNPNSCRMYHQLCSHYNECKLTTEDQIGALMTTTESLAAKLIGGANAAATPGVPNAAPTPAPAAAAPAPAPTAAPTPGPAPAAAAPAPASTAAAAPTPTPAPAPAPAAAAAPTPAPAPAPAAAAAPQPAPAPAGITARVPGASATPLPTSAPAPATRSTPRSRAGPWPPWHPRPGHTQVHLRRRRVSTSRHH